MNGRIRYKCSHFHIAKITLKTFTFTTHHQSMHSNVHSSLSTSLSMLIVIVEITFRSSSIRSFKHSFIAAFYRFDTWFTKSTQHSIEAQGVEQKCHPCTPRLHTQPPSPHPSLTPQHTSCCISLVSQLMPPFPLSVPRDYPPKMPQQQVCLLSFPSTSMSLKH